MFRFHWVIERDFDNIIKYISSKVALLRYRHIMLASEEATYAIMLKSVRNGYNVQ